MNDSLYRWLTNRGFTGSLNDATKAYLVTVVVGAVKEDALHDLWIRYGVQQGIPGEIQEVQRTWAKNQGSTSTATWNGAMGTLPP